MKRIRVQVTFEDVDKDGKVLGSTKKYGAQVYTDVGIREHIAEALSVQVRNAVLQHLPELKK